MKKAIIVLLIVGVSAALFAQASTTPAASPSGANTTAVGDPDPTKVGIETAQQKLMEVSIEKFEAAGFWEAKISSDEGIVTGRLFEGQPALSKAEPTADPRDNNKDTKSADKYVFGVKTEFYQRGYNEIFINAKRPVPIEGITKTVSVWIVGRNYNHTLWLELKDFFGNTYELPMGKLNFQGWKKMTVAIPPQNPDGRTGIVQRNFHYTSHMGLRVTGFRIECDPEEAYGTYYIYLDDLRAVTDLFAEDSRDEDDMSDTW
jgi:hypothetical protein